MLMADALGFQAFDRVSFGYVFGGLKHAEKLGRADLVIRLDDRICLIDDLARPPLRCQSKAKIHAGFQSFMRVFGNSLKKHLKKY